MRSFDVNRGHGTCIGMENILTGQSSSTYWLYGRHIISTSVEQRALHPGQWIEFDVYDNAPGIAYNIRRFGGQGLFDQVPSSMSSSSPVDVVLLYRKHLNQIRFKNQVRKLQSDLTAFVTCVSSSSSSSNTTRTSAS